MNLLLGSYRASLVALLLREMLDILPVEPLYVSKCFPGYDTEVICDFR